MPQLLSSTASLTTEARRVSIGQRIYRGVIIVIALGALALQGAAVWGGYWVAQNHQWLSDRAIALQFEPSPEIRDYALTATMTPEALVYYYASQPEVVPAVEFDRYCSRDEPGIGVLGCYKLGEKRMYLYDVTDPRLSDMEPVIAAHEMLHAVWDRFSEAEKDRLGVLLEDAFAALPDGHPLFERIESYEANDPRSRIPELYALLGTEVNALPAELEQHYGQYFSDRSSVVALAEEVNGVFASFGDELDRLVADLEARGEVIDQRKAEYELAAEILGADIAVYNDRVARYNEGEDIDGAENFDAERNDLISRQAALRSDQEEIQRLIDDHNRLLDELNILNQELTELNQGVNVTVEQQESLEDPDEEAP